MTDSRTRLLLRASILTAVIGYLFALRIPGPGGRTLVIWPYEMVILAGMLSVRRIRVTFVHFGILVWGYLAGLAVLGSYFLATVPLDVWVRGLLITAKCGFALCAFLVASELRLDTKESIGFKRLLATSVVIYGVIILIVAVLSFGINSFTMLTRFRLGSFPISSGPLVYVNPNQLGQLMALAFAVLISDVNAWRWKAFLTILSGLLLILTFSREALLAAATYLILEIRSKRAIIGLFLIAAMVGFAAVVSFLAPADVYSEGRTRLISLLSPISSLIRSRLNVAWAPLWSIAQKHILFGVGPEGIGFITGNSFGTVVANGDNMFLGTLAAYGLVGLLGLSVFLLSLIVQLLRAKPWLGGGEFAFVVRYTWAYLVTGLISPHFLWPYNSLNALVMFLVGLALSEARRRASQGLLRNEVHTHVLGRSVRGRRGQHGALSNCYSQ